MRKDRAERIEYIFQQIEDMGLDTVKKHVKNIYIKLEVSSLPEALYQSARQGWLVNL